MFTSNKCGYSGGLLLKVSPGRCTYTNDPGLHLTSPHLPLSFSSPGGEREEREADRLISFIKVVKVCVRTL